MKSIDGRPRAVLSTSTDAVRHCLWRVRLSGIAILVFSLSTGSFANTLTGLVVGIADGDTFTLLDAAHVQHKIRLAGIDAPEKKQAFSNRSKHSLSSLIFGRQVSVEWNKVDRYGRVIGKVIIGDEDACLAQVRAGLAWHYKASENEQSYVDRERYARAELDARANKRGLWGEPTPLPPWEYRRARKRAH